MQLCSYQTKLPTRFSGVSEGLTSAVLSGLVTAGTVMGSQYLRSYSDADIVCSNRGIKDVVHLVDCQYEQRPLAFEQRIKKIDWSFLRWTVPLAGFVGLCVQPQQDSASEKD